MSGMKTYLETVLWCENEEETGFPLNKNYGLQDVDEESYREAERELSIFLGIVNVLELGSENSKDQIVHDFYLTRNGHGAGFFDGDYPKTGETLGKIAQVFGEQYWFVNDDGKIYLM